MGTIDFEQIRKDAVAKNIDGLGTDGYGQLWIEQAEMASQIAKDMLIQYHQQQNSSDE
nr:hypothetical protein [uncultured Agathobaculum sp.]